jgi:hypothetical protein
VGSELAPTELLEDLIWGCVPLDDLIAGCVPLDLIANDEELSVFDLPFGRLLMILIFD